MDDRFERLGLTRRLLKGLVTDPVSNYLPAEWLKGLLRYGKSEMAAANWADPGGWRSMVISYEGNPAQIADKILVHGGTLSMALRNRLRLASRLLTGLINTAEPPVHVLCLGAGPGSIILRAMAAADVPCEATMVDLNGDAFEYGRDLARRYNLSDRVRYIQGDVRDVGKMLDSPPSLVKMIGICEYLQDEQIVEIAVRLAEAMPPGAPIVMNNITLRHGSDRFCRRVLGLHMRHRSVEQLTALAGMAGFGRFSVHDEPLGVYSVIVGHRLEA
ncbi:MAG: methyltransferase domain-containing protein [Planctomycetes bacterium]|nr:methyltransferase domain-containing protein [Planctomycetota bacterium]